MRPSSLSIKNAYESGIFSHLSEKKWVAETFLIDNYGVRLK